MIFLSMSSLGLTKLNFGSLAQWSKPSASELQKRRSTRARNRWAKIRKHVSNLQERKAAARRRLLNLVKAVKKTPKRATPTPRRSPTPKRSPSKKVFAMYIPPVNWARMNRNAMNRWRMMSELTKSVRK